MENILQEIMANLIEHPAFGSIHMIYGTGYDIEI